MIAKRNGRWGARVYLGDGRYRWLGTFDTKRAAQKAERSATSEPRLPGSLTCDEFADRWLVDYPRAAAASRRTNEYALKGFRADFDGVRVSELVRPAARAWALRNPQSNVRVVRAMFSDAVRDGLAHSNPFSNLRLEQPRGRRDLQVISEPQLERLADVAQETHGEYGPTFRAMLLFAAYVGIRPGEMYVLERRDINFAQGEVHVRQNLDGLNNVKLPKNNQIRRIILPPPAAEALRAMPTSIDEPWLFLTKRGQRLSKSALNYYWRPVRSAFGRPDMAWYELRHFCATLLLEKGISHADVAVQLGHTDSGKLVMSTYGHPSEERARERLKKAFNGRAA